MAMLVSGCSNNAIKVSGPFYLDYIEDPSQVALFRCPSGPSKGCAIDGLPGPEVIAAGASKNFIVVHNTSGYYYFKRVPEERRGWGNNPEEIIGPLSESAFKDAKARFNLPDFTVHP